MAQRKLIVALPVLVGLFSAGPVVSQESFRHARVRFAEGGAVLQRATETAAEEAVRNVPFLPGDRAWTDGSGRMELQFADGSLVWVDRRSKLDYLGHEDRGAGQVSLRLWSGALLLRSADRRDSPAFLVETPAGIVETSRRGFYRIDADGGQARLSVYEGEAVLEADRRVRARAGERLFARGGEVYGEGERLDDWDRDDFTEWAQARQDDLRYADRRGEYLPDEFDPYADELDGHGAWYYESEVGHVWRPYVGPGWQPYTNGRWLWTSFGWTWVPQESWGWVPFHYGRWGHSPALGWYWIPGHAWSPAWVSWAVGHDYVGWSPLGRGDRPVVIHDRGDRYRGRAVPRGEAAGRTGAAWVYARRGDLSARDLSTRIQAGRAVPRDVAVIEAPLGRVTRDLQVQPPSPAAQPRSPQEARTKPVPGDTVPELRSDPVTTIPFPTARRRYESERERDKERQESEARGRSGLAPRPNRALAPGAETGGAVAQPERAAPWAEERAPAPAGTVARPRREGREDADRDLLRPIFKPLSGPRPAPEKPSGSGRGLHPGGSDQGSMRRQPPAPRPPAPPPPPRSDSSGSAKRRRDQ